MKNYNKIATGVTSSDENIKPSTETESKIKPKSRTMVVTNCSRLNVRDKPNLYGHAFHVLNAGDVVTVKDVKDGWANITSGDHIKGYVMEDYLKEG